ncbi:MAG: precorrin-3B synthase [Sporichthyaceae bacterium]
MPSSSADARRAGPDACPGVSTVWSAVDGGLARIRIPGGRLSAAQLVVLAAAGAELGSGVLELTSRANIQVRGLHPAGEHLLAARLREADLLPSDSHDRVRNILASPLTGLGIHGRAGHRDVSALVAELDERLCEDPVLAGLPGRFLFAIDDGSRDTFDPPSDVALRASETGFVLVLGGADWGIAVTEDDAVTVALSAARGFLAERGRHCSPAWRLAELDDGPRRVAAQVLAEVPGLGERVLVERTPAPIIEPGAYGQDGNHHALVIEVPGGVLTAEAARELAGRADADHGLRVTPWRSVVLPGLHASDEVSGAVHPATGARGVRVQESS